MRQIWLYINGQPVDLPAVTKGLLKFSQARSALADVSARIGEFSFPFTLPPTRQNAAVFGVDKLHPLALQKFGYYTDYAYELRAGGQVFAGTFRLTSLKNGYTGTLLGEGLSWALLLGESKLTDLVFPPVAYDGSQLESILAKSCDETDVQFPLVAFGNFFAPPTTRTLADGSTEEVPAPPAAVLDYPLSVDDYPPGVYYGNVLRQIFRSIGWELQSRELDSEFWRQVVHTCAGADLDKAWPWGALLKAKQAGSASVFSYYDPASDNVSSSATASFWEQEQGEIVFLPLSCALVNSPTRALAADTASYTAPRNGLYRFEWTATLSSAQHLWKRGIGSVFLEDYFKPVGLGLVVRRGGQDYTDADGGLCSAFAPGGPLPDYLPGQTRVLTPQRVDANGGAPEALRVGQQFTAATSVYLETGDVVQLCTFARRRIANTAGVVFLARHTFSTEWAGVSLACTHYEDDNGVSKELLQPADFLPPLAMREVVRDWLLKTDSFLVPDTSRRVATIMSRAELSAAGGEPLDLSALCDVRAVEYLPAAGVGVGSFVFSPASNEEPLPVSSDVVTAVVGTGSGTQAVGSLYAPVAFRTVYFPNGVTVPLPTCSTKDVLAQNRSETQPDPGSQPPRLVRYTGTSAVVAVTFMQRTVALAGAAWDGPLCWDGAAGAVGSYYQRTIATAWQGHLGRVSCPVSPALYRALAPGRRVRLFGASYSVAAVQNFDPADEAGLCSVDLEREIL